MPAVISALFSAIYAALAKKDDYKSTLEEIFPAMTEASRANASEIILGVSLFVIYYNSYGFWFIYSTQSRVTAVQQANRVAFR